MLLVSLRTGGLTSSDFIFPSSFFFLLLFLRKSNVFKSFLLYHAAHICIVKSSSSIRSVIFTDISPHSLFRGSRGGGAYIFIHNCQLIIDCIGGGALISVSAHNKSANAYRHVLFCFSILNRPCELGYDMNIFPMPFSYPNVFCVT